ncbi:MAG: hypothetical protein AAF899_18475, partial [Pseudomonadota bacterium]
GGVLLCCGIAVLALGLGAGALAVFPTSLVHRAVRVGNFIRGRQHGFGIMAYSNGTVYEGCWEDGQRAGAQAEGQNCDTATQ